MHPAGHALGMLCILQVPPDAAAPGKQGLRIGGDSRHRHTFDVEVRCPAQQVLAALAAAHGGIVFAPKPREYRYTLNKKVRRLAMKSALSSKVRDNEMIVIDQITADSYKTKTIADMLKAVGSEKKALIVLSTMDEKVIASARNIPGVKTAQVNTLNVYDILGADKFIVVKDAVAKIEEVYA